MITATLDSAASRVAAILMGRGADKVELTEPGVGTLELEQEVVLRPLAQARPPADVPLRRWQQFIDDVGRFLDSGFVQKAMALGWGPFDIFGCDRDRPFARVDRLGLGWLISGNRVVNLFENAAVIQT